MSPEKFRDFRETGPSWLCTSTACSEKLNQSQPGTNPAGVQGSVSRKSRKLFGPDKPFAKLPPAYSVKLVFSYVVKGIKMKIIAKFRASGRLLFEDTKKIVTRNAPERFRDFRETGPRAGFELGIIRVRSPNHVTTPIMPYLP